MSKKYYYQHDETGRICRVDYPLPFDKYTPLTSVQYWEMENLQDGEPCDHIGCLHHVSHPCEGCGRIAGRRLTPRAADGFAASAFGGRVINDANAAWEAIHVTRRR